MKIKKHIVTVIIPVYNVEQYISQCLKSLISQTYKLENIEILIVDDCGQDKSIEIANKFLPSLGEMAQILQYKANKGLGGARNFGIEKASGQYIMFLDSDDYLDSDAIEKLVYSIESNQTDLVIFNMNSFSNSNKRYPQNPSFDLFEIFPNNFKLKRYEYPLYPKLSHSFSACNKLFKKSIFTPNIRFPESQHSEDALLVSHILADSKSISFVNNTFYQYRQRESDSSTSITDTMFQTKEHFFEHLEIAEGLKAISHKYPELEYMYLWVSLRLMGMPIKIYLNNNILNSEDSKAFITRVKKLFNGRDVKYAYNKSISPIVISNILLILNSDKIDKINEIKVSRLKKMKKRGKNYIFNKLEPYKHTLYPYYQFTVQLKRKIHNITSKKATKPTYSMKSKVSKIKNRIEAHSFPENIILIGERPTDARDNAYLFFKYLREQHKELNTYYIITKNSPDFSKVENLGNIIIYDSIEHENLFILSSILISTHSRGTIEPSFFQKTHALSQYKEYYNKKYFFIQHGINLSNFIKAFEKNNYVNASFSKITSGAKPEFEYLSENLGYEDNVVVPIGLARYDALMRRKNEWGSINKILFMPTWRVSLCSPSYLKEKQFGDDKFLNSEYYRKIIDFLNAEELNNILEHNNMELHYIPHPELKPYLNYITSNLPMVKIVHPDTIDLQTELIESKLLITDYSSVFFDFAYMKKPIIFYQHDYEEFTSKHYKKGYFDFKDNYFGETVKTEKDLINNIQQSIKNSFSFSEKAENTHSNFFLHYDEKNCERHYEELISLL